jgi:hypothetical protein
VHLVGFIVRKSVPMHGHMKVKLIKYYMPIITTGQHFPEALCVTAHTNTSVQEQINCLDPQSCHLSDHHQYEQEVEDTDDATKRHMHRHA